MDGVASVELTGVRRSFGPVVAINELSLVVPSGSVTVLLFGPNGAGKTTAVRLVTLRADAGTVRVLGLDPGGVDGTSAKVSSAAAAQQASALVTLPLVLVAYTVARGTLFRTEAAGFGIGSLAWLGAGVAVARFPGGATRAPARHGGLTRPGRAPVRSADPAPVVAGGVPGREGRAASRVASRL